MVRQQQLPFHFIRPSSFWKFLDQVDVNLRRGGWFKFSRLLDKQWVVVQCMVSNLLNNRTNQLVRSCFKSLLTLKTLRSSPDTKNLPFPDLGWRYHHLKNLKPDKKWGNESWRIFNLKRARALLSIKHKNSISQSSILDGNIVKCTGYEPCQKLSSNCSFNRL